jgi:hypothetical protein
MVRLGHIANVHLSASPAQAFYTKVTLPMLNPMEELVAAE